MSNALRLLPPSLKKDDFTVAMVEAFELQMNALHEEFMVLCDFINLTTNDEKVIDMLAFERHVDFYENLSLTEKKNVVKDALKIHMKKGTKYALKQIFETLFLFGEIEEWFEYGGSPFRFKVNVDVTDKGITDETIALLEKLIYIYKNNRSILETLNLTLTNKGSAYTGAYVSMGETIVIDGEE